MRTVWRLVVAAGVAMALLMSVRAVHAQQWTDTQLAAAIVAMSMHAIDWSQTRGFVSTREAGYAGTPIVEKAPITRAIIGDSPSRGQVDAYMLVTGLAVLAIAHALPEYRTTILVAFSVAKLAIVVHNDRLVGLGLGGTF